MHPKDLFDTLLIRAQGDTAVLATLRRSASYEPGLYPPAFPYVEYLVAGQSENRRSIAYLVVACWALATRPRRDQTLQAPLEGLRLPLALKALQAQNATASKSLEARFTALLDADLDELPWRLRHLTTQLAAAGVAVDWPSLLNDLWHWGSEGRSVQIRWARDFWSMPPGQAKAKGMSSAKA